MLCITHQEAKHSLKHSFSFFETLEGRVVIKKMQEEKLSFGCFIGPHHEGHSLIDYLSKRFTYHSRETWRKNIEAGEVTLNEKETEARAVLRNGDQINYVTYKRPEPKVPKKLHILFEDRDLLIVNKCAHIPVHPVGRYLRNTLIHQIKAQRPEGPLFLAHRLDRETTGVCVLSKSTLAKDRMYEQFFHGQVKKTYLALVWGRPPKDTGLIDVPLGLPDPKDPEKASKIRIKQTPWGLKAKNAQTEYRVLKKFFFHSPQIEAPEWPSIPPCFEESEFEDQQGYWPLSLLECTPLTGRTNQIRAHLAHLGCGIVGDKLYDPDESVFCQIADQKPLLDGMQGKPGPKLNSALKKRLLLHAHALHAQQLEFRHPRSQKMLQIRAPRPSEWDFIL